MNFKKFMLTSLLMILSIAPCYSNAVNESNDSHRTSSVSESNRGICVICLKPLSDKVTDLQCAMGTHSFDTDCLIKWFQQCIYENRMGTCPICRQQHPLICDIYDICDICGEKIECDGNKSTALKCGYKKIVHIFHKDCLFSKISLLSDGGISCPVLDCNRHVYSIFPIKCNWCTNLIDHGDYDQITKGLCGNCLVSLII